jgi:hypothetical protein
MQFFLLLHLHTKTTFMHLPFKPVAIAIIALLATASIALLPPQKKEGSSKQQQNLPPNAKKNSSKKIQVAVLLDVSNSMDGLIEQAKGQLWNMVSVMGRARCDGAAPQIEIALYEYGRSSNNQQLGYVKQIKNFTSDLDEISRNLFSLTTNGGDEYCGNVIYTSLNNLQWNAAPDNYKVIFIAGNEDFLQGDVPFTKACTQAKQKGVIVNTIYCGDRMQGIKEHWNLGAECGNGSFTNINQDAVIEDIATPYDNELFSLNEKLNVTYIGYGAMGESKAQLQAEMDTKNYTMNKSAAAKRVAVKGKKELYKNEEWDMVDAQAKDSTFIKKVDMAALPAPLKNKSRAEVEQIVKTKTAERTIIQQKIAVLSIQREKFIKGEKAKKNTSQNTPTLEGAVEKIIKEQAARFKMLIE